MPNNNTFIYNHCFSRGWLKGDGKDVGILYDHRDFLEDDEDDAKETKRRAMQRVQHSIPVSHYALDGYKLTVPANELEPFYQRYANDIEQKHPLYLCEVPLPRRTLMFDLDFDGNDAHPVTEEYILAYTRVLIKCVKKFHPDTDASVHVQLAIPQQGPVSRKKVGVHLCFYGIVTTAERSERLWAYIVQSLISTLGERPSPLKPHEDVVDYAIFRTSLRLLGSWKMSKCPVCHKQVSKDAVVKEPCPTGCQGYGRVSEQRPYLPYVVLNGNGEVAEEVTKMIKAKFVHALMIGTMYVPQDTPLSPWVVPTGAPEFQPVKRKRNKVIRVTLSLDDLKQAILSPEQIIKDIKKRKQQLLAHYKRDEFRNEYKTQQLSKLVVEEDDPRLTMTREWLRTKWPYRDQNDHNPYHDIEIVNMIHNKVRTEYYIYVKGIGDRWCANVKRDHTTHPVYFTISSDKHCYQRCTSRKRVDRDHGPCSEFKSLGVPISVELSHLLFPFQPKWLTGKRGTKLSLKLDNAAAAASSSTTATTTLNPISADLIGVSIPNEHNQARPTWMCRYTSPTPATPLSLKRVSTGALSTPTPGDQLISENLKYLLLFDNLHGH